MAEISKETRDAVLNELSEEELHEEINRRAVFGNLVSPGAACITLERELNSSQLVCIDVHSSYVWGVNDLEWLREHLRKVIARLQR